MNMSHVLHRHGGAHTAADARTTAVPAAASAPPSTAEPAGPASPTPWPRRATALIALLLVAAVVATIAAVVAAGDDQSDEQRLQAQVATLTTERDEALDRLVALDREVADLTARLTAAESDAEQASGRVEQLRGELAAVTEARDAALATTADLTVERDAALAQVAALTGEIDVRDTEIADLTGDVSDLQAKLTAAVKERDEARRRANAQVDVTLVGARLAGTYRTKVTSVAGTAPTFTKLTITTTPEGWLRMSIPGVAEGPLTMVDGSLHYVVGSTTAFPACGGVARQAQVVMTIIPDRYSVTNGGVQRQGLRGVLTAEAPATGSCGAALAMASVDLTAG